MVEYDEGGLPVHLPININAAGDGPVDDGDPEYAETVCWCGTPGCRKYEEVS